MTLSSKSEKISNRIRKKLQCNFSLSPRTYCAWNRDRSLCPCEAKQNGPQSTLTESHSNNLDTTLTFIIPETQFNSFSEMVCSLMYFSNIKSAGNFLILINLGIEDIPFQSSNSTCPASSISPVSLGIRK